jgi:hypothetical protein
VNGRISEDNRTGKCVPEIWPIIKEVNCCIRSYAGGKNGIRAIPVIANNSIRTCPCAGGNLPVKTFRKFQTRKQEFFHTYLIKSCRYDCCGLYRV